MRKFLVAIGVLVAMTAAAGYSYRELLQLKGSSDEALRQLHADYRSRADVASQILKLIELKKGTDWENVRTELSQAQEQALAEDTDQDGSDENQMKRLGKTQTDLTLTLGALFRAVDQDSSLTKNPECMQLMGQLIALNKKVAVAHATYQRSVADFNAHSEKIPERWVNDVFYKFKPLYPVSK
jgi:hypothetical protein